MRGVRSVLGSKPVSLFLRDSLRIRLPISEGLALGRVRAAWVPARTEGPSLTPYRKGEWRRYSAWEPYGASGSASEQLDALEKLPAEKWLARVEDREMRQKFAKAQSAGEKIAWAFEALVEPMLSKPTSRYPAERAREPSVKVI